MNDEFLTKLQKTPHTEFADVLYERISQQSQSGFAQALRQRLTFRTSIVMIAALFLIAAGVYVVTDRGWRKVGDFWIQVEQTHQVSIGPVVTVLPEELAAQAEADGCLPVEEAEEALSFDLRVPAWAPAGYTFNGKVCGVSWLGDFVSVHWEGEHEQSTIQLLVFYRRHADSDTQGNETRQPVIGPVAPGSYEEVDMNGQPAVLVRGDWDYLNKNFETTGQSVQTINSEWDGDLAIRLHWMENGEVAYHLYAPGDISAEDLIRMAESAQ